MGNGLGIMRRMGKSGGGVSIPAGWSENPIFRLDQNRITMALLVRSGRLYVHGGRSENSPNLNTFTNDCLYFDLQTGDVTHLSAGPAGILRDREASIVMDDEWYFATGADENFGRTDTVYRYNIDADTYTSPLATCPFDVSGVKHGVIGGEMYLAGGNQVGADDNFAKYNPATNVWTTLTDAPKIATSACADEAAGRFWIINTGGQLAYYDVALGTWNDGPFAIPPLTMVVPIMACYDGKLYVLSGTGGEDSTQIYDIAGDSWTHLTTAPHVWPGSTYTGHRAYVVDGRFIYTAGGFDGSDLRDEVYRYAMGD